MIVKEFINSSGYIQTEIISENELEAKVIARTTALKTEIFEEIRINGKTVEDSALIFKDISVLTRKNMDVRADDVVEILKHAEKDVKNLQTIKICGVPIREDIVMYLSRRDRFSSLKSQIVKGFGRISPIITMETDVERRLFRLLIEKGHNYNYIGTFEYTKYLWFYKDNKDIRLCDIKDILRQVENDVKNLKEININLAKISKKRQDIKISRKIRVS